MDLNGNPTNPILDEIAKLSPGAQAALVAMHGGVNPPGAAAAPAQQAAPIPMRAPGAGAMPKLAPAQLPSPDLSGDPKMGGGVNPGTASAAPASPALTMTAPAAMPSLTQPAQQVTSEGDDRLLKDQRELARRVSTGSGISQLAGRIENSGFGQRHPLAGRLLGGAAEGVGLLADAAGSAVAPEITAMLPGTEYHHDRLVKQGRANVAEDQAELEKEAQTGLVNAEEAGKAEANAEAPAKAADTHALTESEIAEHNAQASALLHPQAKTDFEAWQAQNPGKPIEEWLKLQRKPASMESKAGTVNGRRVFANYHPDTGKYTDAAGNDISGFVPEPPSALITMGDNHQFQEQERGRGLLDKAEGQYRTAQQGAQGIRAMIDDALQGGKISARMLPLEGALEVTTANGVKRINRTEVDQYAGGGNLFDQLAGKLRGAAAGIPFTDEIMNDMKRLADLQEKGAYENYKGAYDSTTKRYHLTDEQPLGAPGGGEATQTFTDGGVTYNIPASQIADFKKDHPNAR